MGACMSQPEDGIAVVAVAEVDAPLQVLLETFQDVPSQPTYISDNAGVALLKKKRGKLEPVAEEDFVYEEGAVWRETYRWEGDLCDSIESITSLQQENDSKGRPLSNWWTLTINSLNGDPVTMPFLVKSPKRPMCRVAALELMQIVRVRTTMRMMLIRSRCLWMVVIFYPMDAAIYS